MTDFKKRLMEKTGVDQKTLRAVGNYLADNHQAWAEAEHDLWVADGKPGFHTEIDADHLCRLAMALR